MLGRPRHLKASARAAPIGMPVADVPVYHGKFGEREATRLLWRAGFGPKPGEARKLARRFKLQGRRALAHPAARGASGSAGPSRSTATACRSRRSTPTGTTCSGGSTGWCAPTIRLVERMALIWHDWFATADVDSAAAFRSSQAQLFEHQGPRLVRGPAARGDRRPRDARSGSRASTNQAEAPNENYGREMMELFTLGASDESGYPYSEDDVREQARALTGWTARVGRRRRVHRLPLRRPSATTTARRRSSARPAPSTGPTRAACASRTPLTRASSSSKLWSYFIPTPPSRKTRKALEHLYVQRDHAIRPVLEAILMHPDFYRGPGDGEAAGRLHRRAAAGSRPRRRRATGRGSPSSPASVCSARRTSPAGTTRAGSTPRPSAAAGSPPTRSRATTRSTTRPSYDAGESSKTAVRRALALLGRPAAALRRPQGPGALRRRGRRLGDRRLAAGDLPPAAPERAAHADRHLTRHADLLRTRRWPATTATEFTRSHLVRQAVAEAGRGLPRIEPGMPAPAGTGLSRRSFLLRSSAAMLAVYGASKLGLGDLEEGIAKAAGAHRPRAGLDLPGRRHRLALGARADGRRRPTHACARAWRCRRAPARAFAEDPRLRWNPAAEPFDDLHAAGKMTVLPAVGYASPDQSHFTSRHYWEVGGLLPNEVTGWMGRLLDTIGTAGQPASGTLARRLALARAGQPLGAGGGDRRALLRPLGRRASGASRRSYVRRRRRARARRAPPPRTSACARPATPPPRRCSCGRSSSRSRARRSRLRSPTPRGGRAGSATASPRSRRCSPPGCRSAAPRSRRPATSTPTTTRPRASTPTSSDATDTIAAFQADLEARGLADRVITLVWSEFGRRPEENDSGTDHGAGGAAYVIGTQVRGPDDRRVPRPRPARRRRQPARDLRLPRPLLLDRRAVVRRRRRRGDPRRRVVRACRR